MLLSRRLSLLHISSRVILFLVAVLCFEQFFSFVEFDVSEFCVSVRLIFGSLTSLLSLLQLSSHIERSIIIKCSHLKTTKGNSWISCIFISLVSVYFLSRVMSGLFQLPFNCAKSTLYSLDSTFDSQTFP